jgi:carbonic anhydrase/acetyltransferase-like protein (isoleucine patch superfamily)
MPDRAVYLLEAGLSADLPGVTPRAVGASFPFWGTHTLFDFAFAALRGSSSEQCWLVCDSRDRPLAVQAAGRWGRAAVRQKDAEDGLAELRRLAASERAPWVIVSSLSYAAHLEPGWAEGAGEIGAGRRLRADGTLLPVYILPREALLQSVEEATRLPAEAGGSLRGFVMSYLPETIREHADVAGKVFFVDNLMQLWDAHHYLRENLGGKSVSRFMEGLDAAQQPSMEAHIAAAGSVTDSVIASGAQIEGTVVDSFVFPGVLVRRGAEVRQCVVMSGTRVAADAKVSNTLVMPSQQELGGEAETVGAGAEVGEARSAMNNRNDDYPRQIARGLTVIGMNASVPPGMEVGSGCYIGPSVGAVLKNMKKLARGASVR